MTIPQHWTKLQKVLSFQNKLNVSTYNYCAMAVASDKFSDVFSSQNKQRTIDVLSQLDKNLSAAVGVKLGEKTAGVLVPLCYDTQKRPAILFNLRSENLSLNKGEISFPGGSSDESDNGNIIITALRETQEELGIDPESVEIWTTLPGLPTIRSSLQVIPVIGFVKEPVDASKLNINLDEVQYAFTVPLSHLCDPQNWTMTHGTRDGEPYTVPAFNNLQGIVKKENDKIMIWGLTAIVTHITLCGLVPEHYNREVVTDVKKFLVKPKL